MKSRAHKRTNQRKIGAKDGKSSSVILLLFFTLILFWLGFLFYCWKSGRLHSAKIPSLKFVDGFLNNAETSLRDGISNFHSKVAPTNSLPSGVIDDSEQSDIHVIFSTDCSPYQDWQTLVMFYSATAVGQKGPVTRIASGCDDEKKKTLSDLYKKLYPKYHVHFTPDFKRDEKSKRSCESSPFLVYNIHCRRSR